MDIETLAKILGGSAAGAAIVVTFLFVKGFIVAGYQYRAAVERAEKAEQRLWDTLPILRRASEVMDRSMEVTRKVVEEAAKNANGNP